MTVPTLRPTVCAICGIEGNASELYAANLDSKALGPATFSARRLPDRVHCRIVKCNVCGLVRSDPVAETELLVQLYAASTFDYAHEVPHLARTYGRYLAKLDRYSVRHGLLLEVGCGSGFFLDHALARGYRDVRGVEPSRAAVAQAPRSVHDRIICTEIRPGLFGAGMFDVICAFQVLDHLPDPAGFVEQVFALLAAGGMFLCLNHNADAFSSRLLGEYSPIIDIEHTYLYSPTTLTRLLEKAGFEIKDLGGVLNTYSLRYLARLVPAPAALKRAVLAFLEHSRLGRAPLRVPLGNLYAIAKKPESRTQ